jgi:hypothetical protein
MGVGALMSKLELSYEPMTIREFVGLMIVFSVIAAIFLVVGFDRNAFPPLFFGAWGLMVCGLVAFGSLRFSALRGRRAKALGMYDKAALLCFQVGGALALVLVLVR